MSGQSFGSITIVGTATCGDCIRAKQWMHEHDLQFEWLDLDEQPQFIEQVKRWNAELGVERLMQIPVIAVDGAAVLSEPGPQELAAAFSRGAGMAALFESGS